MRTTPDTAGAAGHCKTSALRHLMGDAHIAALCLEHGVSELLFGDRDLLRFTDLTVVNPFA